MAMTHLNPVDDAEGTLPCCGKKAYDLPVGDQLTSVQMMVTCKGFDDE